MSWSETAPGQNFDDKSNDILAWDKYGSTVLDLDRYRYEMKILFYAEAGTQLENWANLSSEKQLIGAKYFFIPYALRMMLLSDDEDKINWSWLIEETQGVPVQTYKGRARTFDEMRKKVADFVRTEQLSMEDSQQMLKDVGEMTDWYIRANTPDFKQWIINEAGSSYENNGFAQKSYFSATLRDELYSIYNGNY